MKIGDRVLILPGTMEVLIERDFVADYITETVDGKTGTIVEDHRSALLCPHWGVDLGFSEPVGIPVDLVKAA